MKSTYTSEELFDFLCEHLYTKGTSSCDLINRHRIQFEKLDQLLPQTNNFYGIVNFNTYKYECFTSNQKNLTGFESEYIQERGIPFLMEQIHPQDAPHIVNGAYKNFMDLTARETKENMKNLLWQTNYRFRRRDGKYIHLLEQCSILEVDDNKNIQLALIHISELPLQSPFKIHAIVKKLSEVDNYKTIFYRVYPNDENGSTFTEREIDIIRRLSQGLTSKQISYELNISYHTVSTHRKNILKKLDVHSSGELINYAISNGII
jgi:DNA-binding CsgD family transcriptional regulator